MAVLFSFYIMICLFFVKMFVCVELIEDDFITVGLVELTPITELFKLLELFASLGIQVPFVKSNIKDPTQPSINLIFVSPHIELNRKLLNDTVN